MAAMYDLTDITGLRADKARSSTVLIWQVPAEWIWPAIGGMVTGLLIVLPLVLVLGPTALALAFLGAPAAVALTVGDGEAPWKRAVAKARSRDRVFLFCGQELDMHPQEVVHIIPSATHSDPADRR